MQRGSTTVELEAGWICRFSIMLQLRTRADLCTQCACLSGLNPLGLAELCWAAAHAQSHVMPCMQPAAAAAAPSRAGVTKAQAAHQPESPSHPRAAAAEIRQSGHRPLLAHQGHRLLPVPPHGEPADLYPPGGRQHALDCPRGHHRRQIHHCLGHVQVPWAPPVMLPVSVTWRILRDVDATISVMSAHLAGHSGPISASLACWLACELALGQGCWEEYGLLQILCCMVCWQSLCWAIKQPAQVSALPAPLCRSGAEASADSSLLTLALCGAALASSSGSC